MEIIINTISDDQSTDDVLDWIYYMGGTAIRLNDEFVFDISTVQINDQELDFSLYSGTKINLNHIKSFWYRRGEIGLLPSYATDSALLEASYNYYNIELIQITNSIYNMMNSHVKSLNKYSDIFTNKLINLIEAKKTGIKIPDTIVTNEFSDLNKFLSIHPEIMMKPIVHNKFIAYNETLDGAGKCAVSTAKVSRKKITDYLNNKNISKFLPTMFQAYVEKKFEVRCFFINDTFYSMAIFSQANEKTKSDFRNYDYERPNRTIPYILPTDIQEKLCKLMKKINMNSGSFDIIVTPEFDHIFLEVNPVGQFNWLSKNCNYFIEKQIAKTLSI